MNEKLSIQQHLIAGKPTRQAADFLVYMNTFTASQYGSGSEVAKLARKASEAASDLVSELDNILFRENPDLSSAACGIYYHQTDNEALTDPVKVQKLIGELNEAQCSAMDGHENFLVHDCLKKAFERYSSDEVFAAWIEFSGCSNSLFSR